MYIKSIYTKTIDNRKSRKQLNNILVASSLLYGEFEILYTLLKDQPIQPSSIGKKLCSEPASVSRVIKTLHIKSHISFEHDVEDRRKIFIRLTKSGSTLIKSILSQSCK